MLKKKAQCQNLVYKIYIDKFMSPVSSVFNIVVTVTIGLKTQLSIHQEQRLTVGGYDSQQIR